jgi:hypothetical protein
MSTQQETLRKLAERYNLVGSDFFKHQYQGFIIITRTGVEKIMAHDKIQVTYQVVPELTEGQENCCVKAIATKVDENGEIFTVESFGTANHYNCPIKDQESGWCPSSLSRRNSGKAGDVSCSTQAHWLLLRGHL